MALQSPDSKSIRAELEEQRCLIERQQVEIQRQSHRIEMQCLRLAYLEAEVDAMRVASRSAAPTSKFPHQPASDGGNGAAHLGRDGGHGLGVRP
jgi:hypothetical protein